MSTSFNQIRAEASARVGLLLGGRFRLERLLGIGGMAAVYKASDTQGKSVAIKVVHDDLSSDEEVIARFRREASLANLIKHPGIVPVSEVGKEGDVLYLVMELLQGRALDFIRRALGGVLPIGCVKWAGIETLRVLAATHQRGVVHRDLKPANLFFTTDGYLRVMDFGIAKPIEDTSGITLHTTAGVLLGTPQFMSPEQARGRWHEVDARSDLFSLGACLFTLATGRPIHEALNSHEALGLAMTVPVRSVRDELPKLDETLSEAIDRALAFKPASRFQSAEEMLSALSGRDLVSSWKPTPCPEMLAHLRSRGIIKDERTAGEFERPAPPADGLRRAERFAGNQLLDSNTLAVTKPGSPQAFATRFSTSGPSASSNESNSVPENYRLLLDQDYWSLWQDAEQKVVLLKRKDTPVTSTTQLLEQNFKIGRKLSPKHKNWGVIVDVRLAPSRNDSEFEDAMRTLRQELSERFARICVLVTSAAGQLQVARIDRGDGQGTFVTRSEAEAFAHAKES